MNVLIVKLLLIIVEYELFTKNLCLIDQLLLSSFLHNLSFNENHNFVVPFIPLLKCQITLLYIFNFHLIQKPVYLDLGKMFEILRFFDCPHVKVSKENLIEFSTQDVLKLFLGQN